jgi:hypothetical protein
LAEWHWQIYRVQTLISIHDLLKPVNAATAHRLASFFSIDSEGECTFDVGRAERAGFKHVLPRWHTVNVKPIENPLSGLSEEAINAWLRETGIETREGLEEHLRWLNNPSNVQEIAGEMLEIEVNRELNRGTCLRLEAGRGERLQVLARNLRAAIFCSLMLEVTGQTSILRRCQACGVWFECLDSRQKFCKPEHRQVAQRRRRATSQRENI